MDGMTLHASRDGQKITVHSTYGPATHAITEDAQHVRHFHTQLGELLDQAALAMVRLFDAAVAMPAVVDACGGDTHLLTEALQRFKPLCCFVGQEALDKIYAETRP